ncbi:MAG TPA: TOBE domain-containing protein, partial [Longimicrobium sp.]|nr:TOBE domain-containing protein [Longimicrobium sp.]
VRGRVLDRRFAGAQSFYRVAVEGGPELLVQGGAADAADGEEVGIAPAPGANVLAFAPEA